MRLLILSVAMAGGLASMPATANNSPDESAATTAEADDKIKCRKVEVTGSLVKRGRVCKTVAQWKAIFNNGNENARAMVIDGTSRPSGQ